MMRGGLLLLLLLVTLLSYCCCQEWKAEQEADRIDRLPGQPKVNFSMYAGYITVNKDHGRAHYYYFAEAQEEPEKKPLVIWHNGGPGCSSIAYGFGEELGPFFINPGGKTLRLNPNAGNKLANIVFVESPAGVGFSYSNTSSDLLTAGDNRTAYDNYAFVVNWLERFPQYKGRPFYLTGESYAGYYVPELSKLIFENNKKLPDDEKINFKGYMVGNPVIDNYYDNWGYVDFLYYHAMISDELYSQIKVVCNFTKANSTLSDKCIQLLYYDTENEYGRIDPYSVYAPACLSNTSFGGNSSSLLNLRRPKLFNPRLGRFRREEYDPCTYDYSLIYFNRPDVQKAMHANTTGIPYEWVGCSDPLFLNWQDQATSVLPIYHELLEAGYRLWVFSGDADSVVPTTGSRYALASLKLPVVVPWYSWYNKQQVGGREIVYKGNLTFVTVRGAGHEVPLLRPTEFLQVFGNFLNGSLLPRDPYT
jgi:serine carboxypeptidase-like clade 2